MNNKKPNTPRLAAIEVMTSMLNQQGSLASLLPRYENRFDGQNTAFFKELCYGCCRYYPQLQTLLEQLLRQPFKPKDRDIEAVLLLGLYQLMMMGVADHAAVNESVNAANYLKKGWAKKLINGVLRRFQREREALLAAAQAQNPFNHPQWLQHSLSSAWPQQAEAVFTANDQHPPFTLRVNRQQHSRESYLEQLQSLGIEAHLGDYSRDSVYLARPLPVEQLPDFQQGAVSVQDEAAQLAAELLQLEPGQRVLDACCAPGGKTCHIAELEPQLAALVALDIEPRRLQKVEANLQRAGVVAQVIAGDATQPDQWWDGQLFDRILLDAPCSATGIIRRQPDIKLLRQPQQVESLVVLQGKLLRALWPLLAPGGILLYATCSVLPQENTQVVEQFLQECPDAVYDPLPVEWGQSQPAGQQLLPQENGHDGFFYGRLRKAPLRNVD